MQLSLRRSLLAFTAFSFSLTPMLAQAQARSPRAGSAIGRFDGLVTLQGTVSRRIDNNEFEVRVGGATFRVRSLTNARIQNGDRVSLRGTFRSNDAFTAQTVRIFGADVDNGSYGNGGYGNGNYGNGGYGNGGYGPATPPDYQGNVDFPATLTRVISAREIEVRGDNGRVYRVETLQNSNYYRVGDKLRVRGQSSGASSIVGAQILTDESAGDFDNGDTTLPDEARSVDFPARIVRLDKTGNEATVRGENGREYLIRGAEVDRFRTGDRVRVRGQANANVVELDRLDLAI